MSPSDSSFVERDMGWFVEVKNRLAFNFVAATLHVFDIIQQRDRHAIHGWHYQGDKGHVVLIATGEKQERRR